MSRRVSLLAGCLFLSFCLHAQLAPTPGITSDLDRHPVRGAVISDDAGAVLATSDADGKFVIPRASERGPVRLHVEAPGFYPLTAEFAPGEPISLLLTPRLIVREEITVVAPRLDIPVGENPAATSLIPATMLEAAPRAVAADEALKSIPGVKVDNQANGERVHVSIRGQGILTERGLRGIEVLLDTIPLNDPSGFVPDLFDVDWASVQEMQVVRGPVAFLYGGGSSGGVIDVRLREGETATHAALWSSGGSNGFYKGHGELSGTAGAIPYYISVARAAGDGYRQHTAFWGDNVIAKAALKQGPRFRLNALVLGTGFFNQNAEGLNLAWLAQDRRMANPDALTFNEYQKTVRFTGALAGEWEASAAQRLSFHFFFRRTRYDEPVPSSVDHRTIAAPGGSLQYDVHGRAASLRHHFSIGTDLDDQFVDDYRHPNLGNAVEGSALVANQSIRQSRAAAYASEQLRLSEHVLVLLGARFDRISNRLDDHLRLNGLNLSGERIFTRPTARAGINWSPGGKVTLYSSWGQGFLPPATEELYANPAALGGFNMALSPARSWGVEAGVRGAAGHRFYYDAAVFRLDTQSDFERYRLPERPLETFYRNAGQSRRYGVETSLRWLPWQRLTVSGAYTYSHFQYSQYDSVTYGANLRGNWLPNSPSHQLFAAGTLDLPRGVQLSVETQALSRAFVDATNRANISGYGLLNSRVAKNWQRGRMHGSVFIAGRNLTATRYIAFTEPDPDGNSYQPGAEREIFVGLQARF